MEGVFSKYLYFGNLPTEISMVEIENYLRKLCAAHGSVRSLDVIQFGSGKHKRKKRDDGKLHCGYGYMEITKCQEDCVKSLKESLADTPTQWQSTITIEEAKKPPEHKNDEDFEDIKKKEEQEKMRQLGREHKKRQLSRNKQIQMEKIKEIVEKLGLLPDDASLYTSLQEQSPFSIDWDMLHPDCDPQRGGGLGSKDGSPTVRSNRKRRQAEGFAALLRRLVDTSDSQVKVVDFGCGSGNLTLALAALFPNLQFIGLDMRQRSIDILQKKVSHSGLTNLQGRVGMIETFDEEFTVALALHACGNATDFALMKAEAVSASFIVSPCCVGKLKFSLTGGTSYSPLWSDYTKKGLTEGSGPDVLLEHPRSLWMRNLLSKEDFGLLAQAADCHADSGQVEKTSKICVEMDRARGMEEKGYSTALVRLTTELTYPKNDAIVGVYGTNKGILKNDFN